MKIVRKGAFETNSSSAHSLVLNKNCRSSRIKKELNKYHTLNLWLGEYGWEEAIYNDTISKLEYIVTNLFYAGSLSTLKDLFTKIINVGVTDIKVDGFVLSYYPTISEFVDDIYEKVDISLDHQASDLLRDLSVDELLMLACSNISYIHTSNDNGGSSVFETLPEFVIKAIKKEVGKDKWKDWEENRKKYSWYNDSDSDTIACNISNDENIFFKGKIED